MSDILTSLALSLSCISPTEGASYIQLSSQVSRSCQNSTFSFFPLHSTNFQVLLIPFVNAFWILLLSIITSLLVQVSIIFGLE